METTQNETETKLAPLDAEVAPHSLASEPVKAARAVIEQHDEANKEILHQRLSEQSVPIPDEVGRLTARRTFSRWKP